jgi:hypothetical protein
VSEPLPPADPSPEALLEHVRVRAYYLFLERNGEAADPVADWLQAEHELVDRSVE